MKQSVPEKISYNDIKSCISAHKFNLPMLVLFQKKEYILKKSEKDGLIMIKSELDDKEKTKKH